MNPSLNKREGEKIWRHAHFTTGLPRDYSVHSLKLNFRVREETWWTLEDMNVKKIEIKCASQKYILWGFWRVPKKIGIKSSNGLKAAPQWLDIKISRPLTVGQPHWVVSSALRIAKFQNVIRTEMMELLDPPLQALHSTRKVSMRLEKASWQYWLPCSRAIQTLEAFSFYRRARSICPLAVQRRHEPNAPTDSSSRTTSVSSQEIDPKGG